MMTINAAVVAGLVVSALVVAAVARLLARAFTAGDVRQVRVSEQWLAQHVSRDVRD